MDRTCAYKYCNNPVIGRANKKYCCKTCGVKAYIAEWRVRTKERAIRYKGGKCSVCGYDKCREALVFHHRDPSKKEFGLSFNGWCRSWERTKAELEKCDLLCRNCHAELHHNEKR